MNKKKQAEKEIAEKEIAEKLKEIKAIYEKVNPEGHYLNLCINENCMWFFNDCFKKDKKYPINWTEVYK